MSRDGGERIVVGLAVAGETPASGGRLLAQEEGVGFVTSSAWSPVLQRVVAIATLERRCLADPLEVETVERQDLVPQTVRRPAEIAPRRFYGSPAAKARPVGRPA